VTVGKASIAVSIALALAVASYGARAQQQALERRRVVGHVLTPADSGMRPVAGAWVTLHRIGFDSAGPVDSVRTSADGSYDIVYRASVDDSAAWSTSTMHGGIAHFSSTFTRRQEVRGDDAEIVVFDTTSAPVEMHVRGRHLVVFAADRDQPRGILEVYEIENDGLKTAIAVGDASTWSAAIHPRAIAPQLDEGGMAAEAVSFDKDRVKVFAPISPGLRQIAFRYRVPPEAFPFEVTLDADVEVLEVLVEEPLAQVTATGASLEEVDPITNENRRLRRFLARHAARGGVVRVALPTPASGRRAPAIALLVSITTVAMAGSLVFALTRPRDVLAAAHHAQ
jgi:hypothetical protein